ncbi:MAG: sel1 repeat family protein [Synergistaceae bacterium]|nr:sel1 repeat family protein [Synergistaceae bacterium]
MGNFIQFAVIFVPAIFIIYIIIQFFMRPNLKQLFAAAERNDPEALFQLSQCYASGNGVKPDTQKMLQCGIRAAELGHHKAQIVLGLIYRDTNDIQNAGKWLCEAAEKELHREAPYSGAIREFGKLCYDFAKNYDGKIDGTWLLQIAAWRFKDPEAQNIVERIMDEDPFIVFSVGVRYHLPKDSVDISKISTEDMMRDMAELPDEYITSPEDVDEFFKNL